MAVPLRKDQELTTADLAQGCVLPSSEPQTRPGRGQWLRNATSPSATWRVRRQPTSDDSTPLFPSGELDGLPASWKEIQTAFVDEPRKAVAQADGLGGAGHQAPRRSLCRGTIEARRPVGSGRQAVNPKTSASRCNGTELFSAAALDLICGPHEADGHVCFLKQRQ